MNMVIHKLIKKILIKRIRQCVAIKSVNFNKNGFEKKTCLYEPIKQWHINIQPFLYGDFITNKGHISIAGFD